MAVEEENTGNEARNERPKQTNTQSRQTTGRDAGDLLDINSLLGTPMSRRTSGESLINAVKAFKHWYSAERQVASGGAIDLSKIQVLGLGSSESNVSVSSVILAYPVEEQGTITVLTHVLALAGSMTEDAVTRNEEINHRTYPVPILASDYVTEAYLKLADDIALRACKNDRKVVKVARTGWRVVAKTVDFNEIENTDVRQVAYYAQAAMVTIYNSVFKPNTYFALDMLSNKSSLEISVDMSRREIPTADGVPRRTDISVTVSGIVRKGDQNVTVPLASISGYIALFYTPPAETGRFSPNKRRDEPYFTPTFVINRMDTNANAITPELLLLALAGSSVISKDQAWAQTLLPGDLGRGEVDYRDTGLLNILGPDQDRSAVEFDNRSSLDTQKWAQYFFGLVDEELAWAIELEEGGDNSWVTSLLSDAATDDTTDKEAITRLYHYANRLTMNNFSKHAESLNVVEPLVMADARYFVGTWIDESSKLSDTREWDLMRWMAVNPNDDGASALAYQDVIDRVDLDPVIRISEQYEQLTSALGASNVQPVRYVDLAYIDPNFIAALAMGVSDCKINIDQRTAQYTFGNRRLRGNTRIRNFVGGDLTHGKLSSRRTTNDDTRGHRSVVRNGFGSSF